MMTNYENFQNYQNSNENLNENLKDEKVVLIENKKDNGFSVFKERFQNFTKLHWNEFKYTILGIIIALLFLTIGFFRTLLIIILYLIGNTYGKFKDGDPKTLIWLERFFNRY